MLWGSFGVVHLISLAVSAGMIFGLYFLLKILPEKVRYWSLFVLSLAGISAIVFNLWAWDSPLEYLPLHMCSITAILLPVVVLTKSKYIGNLLLVWCLGAILALVMNQAQANYEIPSATFFFYFIPHTLEFAVTIYLFKFGYVKKDYKCIPATVGLTVAIYTLVHWANVALNHYCEVNQIVDYAGNVLTFNYMFSMVPTTPIFELFWKMIPAPYWYMYVAIVIVVAYLLVLYLPQIIKETKQKKHITENKE
ncbi:MAG: hypothetical protein E7645_06610 [Ruminococcaceae bacterium]|nr:hypothetical protein [Oscillospiraceae bacterium]